MFQKYMISIDDDINILRIKEYAIIEKIPQKTISLNLAREFYSFLGEETYDGDDILESISKGRSSLIKTIRTRNFFPIEPCAERIADTVKKLCQSSTESSTELFFNDMELLPDSE